MAGVGTVGSGGERPTEGVSSKQTHQSCVSLPEWRSCEQVENGTPSVSPPYWDNDDDDDEGPKPLELYRKHTWKIDKFSKISKRELKSDTFEVGGYKWYILIYPQGCDVCNHLSLFLCVADHDKLLPAWRQFAQFTIAVVNKDPKKSKYSDTLHCFWKKEHDWGWKKFMELSKLLDGFIDNDTLIIKAQVQVIRYREDRPFRCLGSPYRREIVRVYLANVEQICRHFAEERQGKIRNLIDDETRWSSFRAFWLCKDQNSRHRMSREKTEPILKLLVKHFFIEKEVTSTLVMDSIYNGLKALEGQHKGKINKDEYLETEELPIATVRKENNTFVLVDDVLTLLERAAIEPLPPKDEKAPQNRTKDGSLGEDFNKDLTERDERRLTELGRRTIEIFTLAHIFSKIDVSYQEAVSLQRQEELIREEEEAWLARRDAADKEKKSKKKQGKNKRKGKDKGRNDKPNNTAQVKMELDIPSVERKDFVDADPETPLQKFDDIEEIVSIASDSLLCVPEISSEDNSEVHPPTETSNSGIGLSSLQNGTGGIGSSMVDDSSSTCSSDSVPFVAVNGSHKRNSYQKNRRSPSRSMDHQSKLTSDPTERVNEKPSQLSKAAMDVGRNIDRSGSSKAVQSVSQVSDRVVNVAAKRMVKDEASCAVYLTKTPSKNIPANIHPAKPERKDNVANDLPTAKKSSPESHNGKQAETSSRSEFPALKSTEKTPMQQATTKAKKPPSPIVISRPLSAPLIPVSMPSVSMTPKNPAAPILPRSASSDGRSYRNATVGSHIPQNHLTSPRENMPFLYSQPPAPNLSFGSVNRPSLWTESPQSNDIQSLDLYNSVGPSPDEFPHLDIINDLLDEEHGMGNLSVSHAGHQGLGVGPHYLNQQVRFPGDLSGLGPPTSSGRFDMDDRFHHGYGSSRVPYNSQVDGLVPHNQWQMDPPFVGFGNGGGDPYRVAAYQHPSVGANGYMVFRPPSGL